MLGGLWYTRDNINVLGFMPEVSKKKTTNSKGMLKNYVIDILTTESLVQENNLASFVIKEMDDSLTPNYKFMGDCSIEERKPSEAAAQKPDILLVIGLSAYSYGKIYQAIHEGTYEHIIVYDNQVLGFDLERTLGQFISIATMDGSTYRLGCKTSEEVMKRLNNLHSLGAGDKLIPMIVAMTGGKVKAKDKNEEVDPFEALNKKLDEKAKRYQVDNYTQEPSQPLVATPPIFN